MTARPGHEVRLNCIAGVGKPPPDVKWYRQGREVTVSDRVSVLSDGTLIISNAQLEDEDNYTCTAKNIVGDDSSIISLAINGEVVVSFLCFFAL